MTTSTPTTAASSATQPCIDCRSPRTEGPDREGFIDCFNCGAAFIPGIATPDTDIPLAADAI